ncbi:MAG: hypothetical protein R3C19_08660 [Planctomycetaceae bacterium]
MIPVCPLKPWGESPVYGYPGTRSLPLQNREFSDSCYGAPGFVADEIRAALRDGARHVSERVMRPELSIRSSQFAGIVPPDVDNSQRIPADGTPVGNPAIKEILQTVSRQIL